jgi:hypothetical protein
MLAESTNLRLRRRSRFVRNAYSWLRRRLLHRQLLARKRARNSLPQAGSRRVDRDCGFLVLDRPALPHLEEVVREAKGISAARDLEANVPRKKAFLDSKLLDCSSLTLESPFIQFGLHLEVVAAVFHYLRRSAFVFPDSTNTFGRFGHLVKPGMPAYQRLLLDPAAAADPIGRG